jgi:hypothetical protein
MLKKAFAQNVHERFCCNHGYAAATGGLAAQSVNVLPRGRFLPSRLHAPLSRRVCVISRRIAMNNPG